MIHEIKKLINDEGMILLYYIPFDPAPTIGGLRSLVNPVDGGGCRLQGVVHMQVEGDLIPIEFFFPDEVKTPEEAFAVFKITARAHVKQMEEESKEREEQAPRIVTPGDL